MMLDLQILALLLQKSHLVVETHRTRHDTGIMDTALKPPASLTATDLNSSRGDLNTSHSRVSILLPLAL